MVHWSEGQFDEVGAQPISDKEEQTDEIVLLEGQSQPKTEKEHHFATVFLYQVTVCVAIAVIMVLINTFYPQIYQSIDRFLKGELAQTVDFQADSQKAINMLKNKFDKTPISMNSQTEQSKIESQISTSEPVSSVISSQIAGS